MPNSRPESPRYTCYPSFYSPTLPVRRSTRIIAELIGRATHRFLVNPRCERAGIAASPPQPRLLSLLGGFASSHADSHARIALRNDFHRFTAPIDAGRSAVRRCLYMAGLVAIRVCPHFRDYAARIRGRGKPFMVAITAVMRKLIATINAVLASQEPCRYAKAA